jgi:predicted Fe-S protein YdhL (DUF1289 family)
MSAIHITDIEAAINHWRHLQPSDDGFSLAPEIGALAQIYAEMALQHQLLVEETRLTPLAQAAWLAWYHTTPDTPCIAICSTSQGDEVCKGCGRSFAEVQYWTEMRPVEKRAVWQRISHQRTALRFNKYAERAAESKVCRNPD